MKIIFALALVFIAGVFLVSSEKRSLDLDAMHDCIVATATEQGYPYPYSEGAWNLFGPGCKQ